MDAFWFQATYLLETLVMFSKGQDPDGMDMRFTNGNSSVKQSDQPSDFVNAMKAEALRKHDMRKHSSSPRETKTNLSKSLGEIFNKHLKNLRLSHGRSYEKANDLTIIILTDGRWDGMADKYEVNDQIISFATDVFRTESVKHRPVSIQFIQFGEDQAATLRLQNLDNNLKWEGNIP